MTLGPGLALASAMTLALNTVTLRRGVLSGTPGQAIVVTVPLGAVLTVVTLAALGMLPVLGTFTLPGFTWLALAGVVHFNIGRYCNYRAIRAMGANLVGPMQEAGLVWTVFLALLLLDESLTVQQTIGMGIVFTAPVLAVSRPRRAPGALALKHRRANNEFEPQYFEGYAFATLSAISYGTSPIMIAAGLPDGQGVAGGLGGTFISYLAASVLVGFSLFLPGRLREIQRITPTALRWFSVAGLFIGLSQMGRYAALALAPVTVVAPIMKTVILFRLLFGRILNPEYELFNSRVLVAGCLSLVGVILLTVEPRILGRLLALPEWLTTLLGRGLI